MFCRQGRFMFAPDTGADGGATATNAGNVEATATTEEHTADTTDYKALYEREKSEREKLKARFDTTASEIAELKKQSRAKMSEEEQRQAEQAEREKKYQDTLSELFQIKTASVFAKEGISETDYSDLSKKLVETCGDRASEVAEAIMILAKKISKTAVANARNASIVDGARTPAASTGKEEHPYARLATENNNPSNRTEEIKSHYKR